MRNSSFFDNSGGLENAILGTWHLESFVQISKSDASVLYPMGKNPSGTITFTPDSRVVVLIASDCRPKPINLLSVSDHDQLSLYKSFMAYAGVFRFTGEGTGVFLIDISWNQTWVGVSQSKKFILDDDGLTITVGPMIGLAGYEIVATLKWTRR